jgi:hypothetical protein
MVWAGANYPQEHDTAPSECGHSEPKFYIRDDEGIESISCSGCIADELETMLKQGVVWRWEIQRLTDDDDADEPSMSHVDGCPGGGNCHCDD